MRSIIRSIIQSDIKKKKKKKYTNNKGAIYLTSVSLAGLWRPLYFFIILIIYLVYIFLLKLLDLGNLKS
jgi:hypothetical protein